MLSVATASEASSTRFTSSLRRLLSASLVQRRARVGPAASRLASARASGYAWPAGTTRFTRPLRLGGLDTVYGGQSGVRQHQHTRFVGLVKQTVEKTHDAACGRARL